MCHKQEIPHSKLLLKQPEKKKTVYVCVSQLKDLSTWVPTTEKLLPVRILKGNKKEARRHYLFCNNKYKSASNSFLIEAAEIGNVLKLETLQHLGVFPTPQFD